MESKLLLSGKVQVAEPTPVDGDVIPFSLNKDGRIRVASMPASAASSSSFNYTTTASTNALLHKASAGVLMEISVFNPTAATIYVRLYNKNTAPTVGTDVPLVVIPVGTNAQASINYGAIGKRFSNGIVSAVTGGAPNNDATAVAAGALISATYI